jgi:general secretion pathway protein G
MVEKEIMIRYYPNGRRGFTLVELMLTVAVVGILTAIAVPSYQAYTDKTKEKKAIGDIAIISNIIDEFVMGNGILPANLAAVPGTNFPDPWGNPYQYLNIATAKGKGGMRKNRFMVPINSDYDLYSMGKDGQSESPLTAKASRDDIIRANDGQFIGLASNY